MRRGAILTAVIFLPISLAFLFGWVRNGREMNMGRALVRLDLLAIVYVLGPALSGALVGLLKPLIRDSVWRASLVGFLAALPWGAAAALSVYNLDWPLGHSVFALFIAAIFGPIVGQLVRHA